MSAARPTISIITPSLNQAAYLGDALRSVQHQRYPALEHIVLDAGSSDGSPEILQRSAQSPASSLLWRSHPDDGQSAALNEGFLRASGDIVGWLNADDRYRPGCFEAVAHAFASDPTIDILYGDYTFIGPDGDHLQLRREIAFSPFLLKHHRCLTIPTTSTFFRRHIFENGHLLRNDLHFVMDLEFFLRLHRLGYRFLHLPRVLADFRNHPDAKSSRSLKQQQAEHRLIALEDPALTRFLPSLPLRNVAVVLLQIPAAILRSTRKLVAGLYLRRRCHSLFLDEQIQSTNHLLWPNEDPLPPNRESLPKAGIA